MAERKRNKEIHFYVTEEERKLIRRKMIESKTKNMGAYLRKMAIDGYIVNTDTKCNFALSAVLYIIQISFAVHNLFPKDVLPSHLPETAESVL